MQLFTYNLTISLILKNINTSSNSIINGTTFIANNDTTNKNDIIANFPNNTSTENIQFYKSTQFNKKLTVNSNINLTVIYLFPINLFY